MSESDGRAIMDLAVQLARERLGSNLLAAYALGSLAHGGFAPLVSDVDLALVVDRIEANTGKQIETITADVKTRHASELAARLSVFWSDVDGVRAGADGAGRLPELDRLDLLESGALLYGVDHRGGASRPTHDSLVVQSVEFTLARFDDEYRRRLRQPETLVADGPRAVTKSVLFPVRFGYTLRTGLIGRNQDAADWYDGPGSDLVAAAMRWRFEGITDGARALEKLRGSLVALYLRFVDDYVAALQTMGQVDLAGNLEMWSADLR